MAAPGSCVFCDIVAGRTPASIVLREEHICAFMDIRPVNPGHLLVIPNAHAAYLADLPPETGGRLFQAAQRLAEALRASGVRCEGVNLFLADGEAAGQEVFHVHLHVLPRFAGDGFGLRHGPDFPTFPPRSALETAAEAVRKCLAPTA